MFKQYSVENAERNDKLTQDQTKWTKTIEIVDDLYDQDLAKASTNSR